MTGIKISEERISQKEKGIQTDQNRKGKAAQTAASGQQDPVNGSHIIDLTLADINLYGVLPACDSGLDGRSSAPGSLADPALSFGSASSDAVEPGGG